MRSISGRTLIRMNFRQLDLNLLRVLEAIHRTGSVTAAARSLSLTQSATSNALARLRRFFDDDLYVRSPAGLQPTRLAEQLAPAVTAQLRALEGLVLGLGEIFDPATSTTGWRMSLSDLGEMLFLPRLTRALRAEARNAHIANVSVAVGDVATALETREIDCAVGILQPRHRGVRAEFLFREQYVAISAPDWRPGGRTGASLSAAQLAQAALVVASPTATFHDSVEQMLTQLELSHRVVLRARHFGALPDIVTGSDLVAIVPAMYARLLTQHRVRVWKLPYAPRYEVSLAWHASTARDPAQQWLRALVHRLFGQRAGRAAQAGSNSTG